MARVKDKLWLWGHEAEAHNGEWGLPGHSRITPAEAAQYMGMPNVILVRYSYQKPVRMAEYLPALSWANRVLVSVVGAGGFVEGDEIGAARDLAARYPNVLGVQLDDFFGGAGPHEAPVYSPAELHAMKARLALPGRQMETWVTLYGHQVDMPIQEHLDQCDVVEYWTWHARDLDVLDQNFERVEAQFPRARKALGCYFWNYGDNEPMPIEGVEKQSRLGLKWLQERRIEAMIWVASCVVDRGLEAVEWTRKWIAEVGDIEL